MERENVLFQWYEPQQRCSRFNKWQFTIWIEIYNPRQWWSVCFDRCTYSTRLFYSWIYTPQTEHRTTFVLSNMLSLLDESNCDWSSQFIVGGDFNVHLNADLGNQGGRVERKDSVKSITDIKLAYEHTEIIPFIKSDHSAGALQINSIEDQTHGPWHWILNSSLLEDDNYTIAYRPIMRNNYLDSIQFYYDLLISILFPLKYFYCFYYNFSFSRFL